MAPTMAPQEQQQLQHSQQPPPLRQHPAFADTSSNEDEDEAKATKTKTLHVYASLEALNRRHDEQQQQNRRRKRPATALAALCLLTAASGGGVAVAVVQMVHPGTAAGTADGGAAGNASTAADVARDLVLFASGLGLFYVGVHALGARGAARRRPGTYTGGLRRKGGGGDGLGVGVGGGGGEWGQGKKGKTLLAGAVLLARVAAAVWGGAAVATAVTLAGEGRAFVLGARGVVVWLGLLACVVALPCLVILSLIIDKNPNPFVTAGFSPRSALTSSRRGQQEQVAEASDDGEEAAAQESAIVRRASLLLRSIMAPGRRSLLSMGGSTLADPRGTLPSSQQQPQPAQQQELWRTSKPGHVTIREVKSVGGGNGGNGSGDDGLRTLLLAAGSGSPSLSPSKHLSAPVPVYVPSGWRGEWNRVAAQVGLPALTAGEFASGEETKSSAAASTAPATAPATDATRGSGSLFSRYSSASARTLLGSMNYQQQQQQQEVPRGRTWTQQQQQQQQQQQLLTPSTAPASPTRRRSGLSTVRYADQPEYAVRSATSVRVVSRERSSSMSPRRKSTAGLTYMPSNSSLISSSSSTSPSTTIPLTRRNSDSAGAARVYTAPSSSGAASNIITVPALLRSPPKLRRGSGADGPGSSPSASVVSFQAQVAIALPSGHPALLHHPQLHPQLHQPQMQPKQPQQQQQQPLKSALKRPGSHHRKALSTGTIGMQGQGQGLRPLYLGTGGAGLGTLPPIREQGPAPAPVRYKHRRYESELVDDREVKKVMRGLGGV